MQPRCSTPPLSEVADMARRQEELTAKKEAVERDLASEASARRRGALQRSQQ